MLLAAAEKLEHRSRWIGVLRSMPCGNRTLLAIIAFLRPLWVQRKYPDLPLSTPWHDWPEELRTTYDLDTIPQELNWSGWCTSEPLDEGAVVPAESRLGKLIQPADEEQVVSGTPPLPPLVVPPVRKQPGTSSPSSDRR